MPATTVQPSRSEAEAELTRRANIAAGYADHCRRRACEMRAQAAELDRCASENDTTVKRLRDQAAFLLGA